MEARVYIQPSRNNKHSKNIMEIQTDSSPIKVYFASIEFI
jgi:hypothetical protein